MERRLSDELTMLTTRLMMCASKREIINISGEFGKLIERVIAQEANTYTPSEKSVTATIKFTREEVANMAKTFKKEFIANGLVARVIKRESGKNSFVYEIRYRRNGYNITASSTDLAEAKRKFLDKTSPENLREYYVGQAPSNNTPTNFERFALYYFETFRKRKVAARTYLNDTNRLKKHILPVFGQLDIKKITPQNCQTLIDSLMEQDKCKTAVEIYNLLSCIFKNAVAHNLLTRNPLDIVIKPTYDQEHGTALTLQEEAALVNSLTGSRFDVAISLALFCGLRPNEIANETNPPSIKNGFIIAVNSKRHSKDKTIIEYKRIPITDKLKPFIKNGIPTVPPLNVLRKHFSKLLPNHKLYDCRTTFYSRCKECGVDQRALDEYMGHSLGKIGNAYTDLSDEFLLKEAEKIKY